jgi:hypothetical protein
MFLMASLMSFNLLNSETLKNEEFANELLYLLNFYKLFVIV